MAAAKIKKGDQVIVLSGKDKGKTGTVTRVDAEGRQGRRGRREHRETRHRRPDQANPQGGLERIEAPLHISKVAHVAADGKPTASRPRTARRSAWPSRPKHRWLMPTSPG
ncbi:50S ribosomal protein L24 [Sphingomonas sp. MMS24-JH45]